MGLLPPVIRVQAFSPAFHRATQNSKSLASPSRIFFSTTTQEDADGPLPNPSDMKLREIQSELKERKVSFADCFDRESLATRLMEARESNPIVAHDDDVCESVSAEAESKSSATETEPPKEEPAPAGTSAQKSQPESEFDRQSTLESLRSLRIKELRTQLSQNNVRWGTMIEKEELVQALCNVMEMKFLASQNFSRSGEIMPGTVTDVDDKILLSELGWSSGSDAVAGSGEDGEKPHAPILLDVYATWCGPCQFLVPQLKEAAEELGPDVRIVKLDSDKYPQLASQLKVGGLPTLILFDGGDKSKEVDRMEGALTKDGIVQFVKKSFK